MEGPYVVWKEQIYTFIQVCRSFSLYVNKDMIKLISLNVKFDFTMKIDGCVLSNGTWQHEYMNFIYPPCHTCLLPLKRQQNQRGSVFYTCKVHGYMFNIADESECQNRCSFSISRKCMNKRKKRFIF